MQKLKKLFSDGMPEENHKKNKQKSHIPFRLNLLFFIVFTLFVALIIQLGYLQIINGDSLQEKIEASSVRKVETLVKELNAANEVTEKPEEKTKKTKEEYNLLKKHLSDFFNTKVQVSCSTKGKGKISISFQNEEELERIMEIFDSLKK